jgi:hypothetical protein
MDILGFGRYVRFWYIKSTLLFIVSVIASHYSDSLRQAPIPDETVGEKPAAGYGLIYSPVGTQMFFTCMDSCRNSCPSPSSWLSQSR